MTVVGAVEIQVSALVDQNQFTRQINQQLRVPMQNAGTASGRVMGRQVGESAAVELEKSGARFARSGRLLSNVFTSNSASALGPLQEVADRVSLIGATLDQTKTKAGGMLLGVGAAATGIGAFLSTLASREQGATNRLAASIAAAGGNIDDYRTRIDEAVKSGEKFGQSGNQTIDAIQALTIGLHDPKKALDELGLAENIAAAKQISLGSAANLVRQAYNGNTRVLKAFGIQVSGIIDGQKLLKDAHEKAGKASSDAAKAQHDYDNKLAIYRDTLKPTLSQQLALKDAHDKTLTTQLALTAAQHEMTDAQNKANAAGQKGQQVLDQLAKVTAGQASASASTFTGHLKAIGATVEDNAAKIGGKAGHALIEFGPALAAGGFLIESGLLPKIGRGVLGFIGLGRQAVVTAGEVGASAAEEDASLGTVVLAIRELQAALTGIGPAAAEGAVGVGEATTAMDVELTATTVKAATLGARLRGLVGLGGGAAGIGALGALGGLAFLGVGMFPDEQKPITPGKLNEKQSELLTDSLIQSRRAKLVKASTDDLTAILNTLPKSSDLRVQRARAAIIGVLADRIPAAVINAEQRTLVDDATAERRAQQHGHSIAVGIKKGAASVKPQTLAEYLASLGLGPVANSALDKALADAQKAAGARAKQIGNEVTAGIRAQVATVKHEISGLNEELKKVSDFRGQVIGQAASFTSLTGVLGDNSLATAGGLSGGLASRVAAERLFGRNLALLAKRGLSRSLLAQLAAAGPDAGRADAAALVAGSDADIRQINLSQHAAEQQAQILAGQAVDAKFGAGTQARANVELARLNAKLALLNRQIAGQAVAIGKAVAQAEHNATVTKTTKSRTAVAR